MKTNGWKAVWIDGALYFVMGLGGTLLTYLSGEEAYKYVNPELLFWLKALIGSTIAGLSGLKAFRSLTFATHKQQVEQLEKVEPKLP